jgi:hypothetical protein
MWHLLRKFRILQIEEYEKFIRCTSHPVYDFLAAHHFPHAEEGIFLPLIFHHCIIGVAVTHMWS